MSLRKVFKRFILLRTSAILSSTSSQRCKHDLNKEVSTTIKNDDEENFNSDEDYYPEVPRKRLEFMKRYEEKSEEGISQETFKSFNQDYDFSLAGLKRAALKQTYERIKEEQRYNSLSFDQLGPDIGAAHFIVGRNGAVKFKDKDHWVRKSGDGSFILPGQKVPNLVIEAIDASNTDLMFEGLEYFEEIAELKFLNLSNCKYIDDFCLSKLQMFKDTLEVLDLTGCQRVTENGITALHHLKNLRVLCIADTPNIKHKEILTLYLEETLENCVVRGIDHDNIITEDTDLSHGSTDYLERLNTNAMIHKLLQQNDQTGIELLQEKVKEMQELSSYNVNNSSVKEEKDNVII